MFQTVYVFSFFYVGIRKKLDGLIPGEGKTCTRDEKTEKGQIKQKWSILLFSYRMLRERFIFLSISISLPDNQII